MEEGGVGRSASSSSAGRTRIGVRVFYGTIWDDVGRANFVKNGGRGDFKPSPPPKKTGFHTSKRISYSPRLQLFYRGAIIIGNTPQNGIASPNYCKEIRHIGRVRRHRPHRPQEPNRSRPLLLGELRKKMPTPPKSQKLPSSSLFTHPTSSNSDHFPDVFFFFIDRNEITK